MQLNPPQAVRATIYVVSVLGTAIIVPLHAAEVVPDLVLTIWSSVSGAASALAAVNVSRTLSK